MFAELYNGKSENSLADIILVNFDVYWKIKWLQVIFLIYENAAEDPYEKIESCKIL